MGRRPVTEGDQVNTQAKWAMVLVLGTALAGCGEHGGVRASAQPEPKQAPCAAAPAPATASAAPVSPAPAVSAQAPAAPEPRRTALAADDKLTVRRFVLARGVRNREPVDEGTSFKSDSRKLYAFVEVENRGGAPAEIVVEFEPPGGGAPHGDVTLAVGAAPRWRTWAYTRTASTAGSWTAVVKNRKGQVLARAPFEVTL
jgi:hypothetical protein